jgi:hypothetical protein
MSKSGVAKAKGADNRRAPRQRAFLRAKLSYHDGAIAFDCVVNQISSNGAKIVLSENVALPERFRIEISQKNIDRTATLVRRDADGAAIAFVAAEEAEDASESALQLRLRLLEAENKMLRANCDALLVQLERSKASY